MMPNLASVVLHMPKPGTNEEDERLQDGCHIAKVENVGWTAAPYLWHYTNLAIDFAGYIDFETRTRVLMEFEMRKQAEAARPREWWEERSHIRHCKWVGLVFLTWPQICNHNPCCSNFELLQG